MFNDALLQTLFW